jgi:hypothetical protein
MIDAQFLPEAGLFAISIYDTRDVTLAADLSRGRTSASFLAATPAAISVAMTIRLTG